MMAALYGDFSRVLHHLSSYRTPTATPCGVPGAAPAVAQAPLLSMLRYYVQHRTQWAQVLVDSDPRTTRAFLSQFPLWALVCLLACCSAPPSPPSRPPGGASASSASSSSPYPIATTPDEKEEEKVEEAEEKEEGKEEEEAARAALVLLFSCAAAKTWPYRLQWVYHNTHLSCWDRLALALLLERCPSSSSSPATGKAAVVADDPHTTTITTTTTTTSKDDGTPLPSALPFSSPSLPLHRLYAVLHVLYQDGSALQALLLRHGIGEGSIPWIQMVVDETSDYLLGACLFARVGIRGGIEEEEEEESPPTMEPPLSRFSSYEHHGMDSLDGPPPSPPSPSSSLPLSDVVVPSFTSHSHVECRSTVEEERANRLARWRARVRDEECWMEKEETVSSSSSSSSSVSASVNTASSSSPLPRPSSSGVVSSRSPERLHVEEEAQKHTSPQMMIQPTKEKKKDHRLLPPPSPPPPPRFSPAIHEPWRWWVDAHLAALQSTQSFIERTEFSISCRQLRAAYLSSSSSSPSPSSFSLSSSRGSSRFPLYRLRHAMLQWIIPPARRMTSWCGPSRYRWCEVCDEKVEEGEIEWMTTVTQEEELQRKMCGRRSHGKERKEKSNAKEESSTQADDGRFRFPLPSSSSSSVRLRSSPLAWSSTYVQCAMCGHGGHLHHIRGWFDTHRVCPAENCTCCCNEG